MKKRRFRILLIIGASLIVISLILVIGFQIRVYIGYGKSKAVVAKINEMIPEKYAGIPSFSNGVDMPVWEVDGTDYMAILEIPSMDIVLPVADNWDNNNLMDSPARFYGYVHRKTMVIGGGDYSHQFSFCDKIDNGTVITLTDMYGGQFFYEVSRVDRSESAKNTWLINTSYDLTLFCRDMYSMEYIAVRCDFVYS